jgi:hypothetical protein
MDLVINEDGTYQCTLTYNYTAANGDKHSGSLTTNLKHWSLGESNERNSSIMFEDMPVIAFTAIAFGNIVKADQIWYFDQEATDKDNMVFNFSGTASGVHTAVDEMASCTVTVTVDGDTTSTGTATLARQE